MGLFSNQLANVVEWEEYRDDVLFWKWSNKEIKKGSRLILRQGQDLVHGRASLFAHCVRSPRCTRG